MMAYRRANFLFSHLTFFWVFVLLVCFDAPCFGQKKYGWETVRFEGVNYVTLRSVKEFYGFQRISYGKKIVLEHNDSDPKNSLHVEFNDGSQTCRMNGVLFILSSRIVRRAGRYLLSQTDLVQLVDPVLRPRHIQKARRVRTVIVDAGHGGYDPGARGYYSSEKVYTLKVARKLRNLLQAREYRVVMTRDSDTFVSLRNRVHIANGYPGAVFISIHFNAGKRSANGIETFTISPVGVPHMDRGLRAGDFRLVPGNEAGSASIALATAIHSRALIFLNKGGTDFKMEDRGIKRARFNVLTGIRIPAVLLEGGFLSNKREARNVHSETFQTMLAASIVRAVDIYSGSVSR